MVICAIDNLTKGASGGALQAANVALGLDETAGLTSVGLYP
jgi:N-acetyl-gamma-glutamylphosphate reductase